MYNVFYQVQNTIQVLPKVYTREQALAEQDQLKAMGYPAFIDSAINIIMVG